MHSQSQNITESVNGASLQEDQGTNNVQLSENSSNDVEIVTANEISTINS